MKKESDQERPCPCGTGDAYSFCCAPFHQGQLPNSALKLMRSRYSAYALGIPAYIISTTHPASPYFCHDATQWANKISERYSHTEFKKLEILNSQENDQFATITFVAHLAQNTKDASFTERSYFEKIKGKWLYHSGQLSEGVNRDAANQSFHSQLVNSITANGDYTRKIAIDYARRIWSEKDLHAIDELLHSKIVIHSLLGDFHGPEAMKKVVHVWLQGFPDLVVENTLVICEQDIVVIHWHAQGTHQGEFKGIQPTQKSVFYAGVSIYRISDNKIIEYWAYLDMQHLLKQIS